MSLHISNCQKFCNLASLAAVGAVEVRDEVSGRVGGEGAEGGEALEHVARLLAVAAELLLHDLVSLVGELRRPARLKVLQQVIPRIVLQFKSRLRSSLNTYIGKNLNCCCQRLRENRITICLFLTP